ncbi:MAG TPA: 6-phosphogluconolactonase [Solirubrobacteraceae bacterium]|jgi:6-phosphogluconolactonase|nr:6-phosphogluconolactonase [Solirubrobacteraceae bacterium]
MTRLTTCPDAEAVAGRAAALIARQLQEALQARGAAHLALSGGTTPGATYELLAAEMPRWEAVELWFADERCVAPEDPNSNYRLARETLLDRVPIGAGQVHRMEGELGPEEGAAGYAAALREHLGERPEIDTVVLGIGPDGHVASLFPGAEALDADPAELCLGVHDSPKPPPERLTLTLEVLRRARSCVLLATGASKADAIAAMLGEPSRHVPASLLRRERLSVIVDDAAAPPPP